MPLSYLIDEHFRGPLKLAVRQHNNRGGLSIDAVVVGDPPDLPLGSKDPRILAWAEREGRLIVSRDYKIPIHVAAHLQAGQHLPGVLLVVPSSQIDELVSALELISHAGFAEDYFDRILFIP